MAEIAAPGVERGAGRPAWWSRRWLLLAVSVALLGLLGLLWYGLRVGPNSEVSGVVPLNGPAPNFTVTTLDGKQLKLSDLRGRPVVINFWGSWCVPCQAESGELNQAYARYQGRDVAFVGIAWADQDSEARKFVQHYKVPYAVALDDGGRLAIGYGITGVPETFFVDRDGRLTQKWVGPITAAHLGALVEPLLAP